MNSLSSSKRKGNSGRFEIGPIDAGYAREFANSLRRVLLSGLPGAAITSILIKNVQHEFQDIPHVKEDVVDIVQNIKKVRLRSYMDRAVHVRLDAQGESEVYAGDIRVPGTIEIVNPSQHIATLDNEQAHLVMELVVETGRGFVSAELQKEQKPEQPIGVILVDAIYSPVVHVNFTIEEIGRGRQENLDTIVLSITTDGTISPSEALRQSADILRQQFMVFSHPFGIPGKPAHLSDTRIPMYICAMDIEDLRLSVRTVNALRRNGVTKVGRILEMDEEQLTTIRNFGQKGLQELCECLQKKGLLPKQTTEKKSERG